jgi:hypothetical protein
MSAAIKAMERNSFIFFSNHYHDDADCQRKGDTTA